MGLENVPSSPLAHCCGSEHWITGKEAMVTSDQRTGLNRPNDSLRIQYRSWVTAGQSEVFPVTGRQSDLISSCAGL